jgi:hypothetical protein
MCVFFKFGVRRLGGLVPWRGASRIYLMAEVLRTSIMAYKFKINSNFGSLKQVELELIKLALVDVRKVRILLRKNHKTKCFQLVFKEDLKDFAILVNFVSLCGGETWMNGRFDIDFYSKIIIIWWFFSSKICGRFALG